jgi:maltose alpha-D-glucosyltransferase/alpha-amylase
MQWSPDRNAGFSRAHPHRVYLPLIEDPEYHYQAVNVEAQQANAGSLLWFTKHLIAMRKRYRAFGRGSLAFLPTDNRCILAFLRCYEDERVLVVANLSRFLQVADLDLGEYRGSIPVEMVGRTTVRPTSDGKLTLTLGPHSIYWFSLERTASDARNPAERAADASARVVAVDAWYELVVGRARTRLEALLPAYLERRGWFAGRTRRLLATRVVEAIAVPLPEARAYLAMVRVDYADGEPDTYLLPLGFAPEGRMRDGAVVPAKARIAEVQEGGPGGPTGVLYDAIYEPTLAAALLDPRVRTLRGAHGVATPASRARQPSESSLPRGRLTYVEGTNTVVVQDDHAALKLYRRLEEGPHPEVELGALLTEQSFDHVPALLGAWEYRRERAEPVMLAAMRRFVPNDGTLWSATVAAVDEFLDRAWTQAAPPGRLTPSTSALLGLAAEEPTRLACELLGPYLDLAHRVGRCTAELHAALADGHDRPELAPEPLTPFALRARYEAARGAIGRLARELRGDHPDVDDPTRTEIRMLDRRLPEAIGRLRWLLERRVVARRIRCHGDLHLGQILRSGDGLTIVDFSGEPTWPLAARRIKRSPLRDVATMLRSLDRAARCAAQGPRPAGGRAGGTRSTTARTRSGPPSDWTRFWYASAAARFLRGYLDAIAAVAGLGDLLPASRDDRALLLDALMLEKAVQEVQYELEHRPQSVGVAVRGLLDLLDAPPILSQGADIP